MRKSTSTVTIKKMRQIFATHELPVLLVSPCFSSQDFKTSLKVNGIRHIFTIIHPQMGWRSAVFAHSWKF